MKKIILLMSFIVLTTIAHAFNYGSITVYQDGEWSAPFYIKTSVIYNETRKIITFSNNKWGKMVLKITSSKRQGDVEYHMCRDTKTNKYYIITITEENNIPYISLSPSKDVIYLFGF